MFCSGCESIFKFLRRLNDKSGENDTVSLARLFEVASKAGPKSFPNVNQAEVSVDDYASVRGPGKYDDIRSNLTRLSVDKCSLAMSNFKPNIRQPKLKRPVAGEKTCGASAHSSQVAFEECLLKLDLDRRGNIVDLRPLTHSWASGLVKTVAATATDLDKPAVLAHPDSGQAWLAIMNASRAILGWPLRIESSKECILSLISPVLPDQIETLIITRPCPPKSLPNARHSTTHPDFTTLTND